MAKTLDQVGVWRPGGNPSASDFNAVTNAARDMFGSMLSDGFIDSSGVHIRRASPRRIGLLFIVNLNRISGSAGDATTPCGYVYEVTDLGGDLLAATQQPLAGRPARGAMIAATKGIGYYDSDGAFILLSAFEAPDMETCS